MNDECIKRMRIKAAQELVGDEPMLIREYLSSFPLPLLGRVLIELNITVANSIFPQIANNAPKLIDFICSGVASDKIKSSLDKINKLVKDVESDAFSDGCIVWLKNDVEACHYFWWNLMQLEWRDVFKILKADNIHRYSDVGDTQQAQYVSDTFCLPCVVGGHKERYKSILVLLSLLPFKNTEINLLISYFSCNYKKCKEICRSDVNVTSLIKSKESVSFSICYLKKKNMFSADLVPLTESDNKYALITQLYMLTREDNFKELVTSLTKAWSQKKVREKRKETDKKQTAVLLGLSKESIRMLKELSKKHSMDHSELIELAVQSLFEQTQ
ncbi:hypothetical protein F1511_07345 [Klebsiella oxytoca]|uniref:hypothetical protein n=1 Tax=Klebsiella TaxID=570 RepID=UPI0018C79323|nr:hypothetical protein [Klebsiella oxytoca]MBG2705036.1 hypothetical protein [Klebsiella oxytoca]HEJ7344389.1 hypothetical protein [Klebsiella oxytoca]